MCADLPGQLHSHSSTMGRGQGQLVAQVPATAGTFRGANPSKSHRASTFTRNSTSLTPGVSPLLSTVDGFFFFPLVAADSGIWATNCTGLLASFAMGTAVLLATGLTGAAVDVIPEPVWFFCLPLDARSEFVPLPLCPDVFAPWLAAQPVAGHAGLPAWFVAVVLTSDHR
jgi:hypothetical protein